MVGRGCPDCSSFLDDTGPCGDCGWGRLLGDRVPVGMIYATLEPTKGPMPDKISAFYPDEKETLGDWAVVVQAIYNITGRGKVANGLILYGKPAVGDQIVIPDKAKGTVKGVEHYCISYWYGAGGNCGILSDMEPEIGQVLVGWKKQKNQ